MRHLAVAALLIAAVSVTASETDAQPSEEPPLPLVIEDDGTIRMHGDTLVVRPDGTVSMGDFEFRRGGEGDLEIGHRDSERRLTMKKSGYISIGTGINTQTGHSQGITVDANGGIHIGYEESGFFAWPDGTFGARALDGKRLFYGSEEGELLFDQKVVTGAVVIENPNSGSKRCAGGLGSGECSGKAPKCSTGTLKKLIYVTDFTDADIYLCFGF